MIGEAEPDPAIGRSDGTRAHPHHVAGGAQLVEVARPVVEDPRRQDVGLDRRGDERCPREQAERFDDGVDAPSLARYAVPGREEPRQRGRLDRLDLAAQGGQRAAPEPAQHLDVAPLSDDATRSELAQHDLPPPSAASPSASARSTPSTRSTGNARRRPTSAAVNGPCVRAYRPTSASSGRGRAR